MGLKEATLPHSKGVCAHRARGREIQGTEQNRTERQRGLQYYMGSSYMAIVASQVSEKRMDCSIKDWDTTASPENNAVIIICLTPYI